MMSRSRPGNSLQRAMIAARSERGIALVMCLIVLVSLTGLVLAFLAMSAFEPQISQNLVDTINARMLADSGIESAYNTLVNTPNWSTVLAGATTATCAPGASGILLGTSNGPLPGLPALNGTFTVRVRNDCQVADGAMTGVVPELALDPATDANNRLVVESTGLKNNAARTISAVIRRVAIPSLNAALAFPGVQADVNFNGSSFVVDGRDTRLADSPGSPTGAATSVFGITTSAEYPGNATQIQVALANNQQNTVYGRNPSGPGTAQGDSAVTPDASLTSQMVIDFANAVRGMADITLSSSSANPVSIRDLGATCGGNINDGKCWGTDAHPKIIYIKGDLANVNEQFTSLDIAGNSAGTGILIVENGNVGISGNFQWHGPVIVTGNNVGIQYRGGGDQVIMGGTIVNELHNDGGANLEGDVRGNAKLVYSREAMDLVTRGLNRRLTTIYSWRER